MAKIIVFVPSSRMLNQAEDLIRERHIEARAISTDSEHILGILEKERERGAMVAVARGNHAHLIKENTDMPLSEMCLSGQELMVLVHKAMSLCESKSDLIALVGFYNMFTDIEPIARVLDVNARIYYASGSKAVEATVHQAHKDGAKVVIGGEMAMRCAQTLGLKALFLDSTRESLMTAIMQAKRICYGIESEQRKAQEITSLMNYSFDAVLRLDKDGIVRIANGNAEIAFHMPAGQLSGRYILDLLKVPEDSPLKKALLERRNAYSSMVLIGDEEYVVNLAALHEGGVYAGAILSMQRFGRMNSLREDAWLRDAAKKQRAVRTLSEYAYTSEAMKRLKEDAQKVAPYDLPVLITGAHGTDRARLAEAIHNAGKRPDKPFIRMDMSIMPGALQEQNLTIIGGQNRPVTPLEMAMTGTVLIENVEMLSSAAQVLLLYICRNHWILGANGQPAFPVSCRIMTTAGEGLVKAVEQGTFSLPLFLELARVTLRIPSLSEREKDIRQIISEQMDHFTRKYRKQVKLRGDALDTLLSYQWIYDEGEVADLVEKIVLFAADAEIGRELVERVMAYRIYVDKTHAIAADEQTLENEAEEIRQALANYRGNRGQVAEALGMSKTTLWRKMKKYKLI